MLKKISEKTVELIKEKILNAELVKLPITEESLEIIYDWFEEEEVTLANAKAEGEKVAQLYFDDICKAVDELFSGDEMSPDLNYLNEKLK